MQKIRGGDEVIVLAGKDKGKRGKVLRILPQKDRAIVEGIQLVKKHVRPNPRTNQEGGIVEKEAAIHISNIALYNPATKKADKVAIKIVEGKDKKLKRVRIYKSTQKEVGIEAKE